MEPIIFRYYSIPRSHRKFPRKVYKSHRDVVRNLALCNAEIRLSRGLNLFYGWDLECVKFCVGLLGNLFRETVAFTHAESLYTLGESIDISVVPTEIRDLCHDTYRSKRTLCIRLTLALCSSVNQSWEKLNIIPSKCLELLYRDETMIEDVYREPLFEVFTLCSFHQKN